MVNQEFKAQGTKYKMLPNFGICCRELGGGAQSYEILHMRAQLLLCPYCIKCAYFCALKPYHR